MGKPTFPGNPGNRWTVFTNQILVITEPRATWLSLREKSSGNNVRWVPSSKTAMLVGDCCWSSPQPLVHQEQFSHAFDSNKYVIINELMTSHLVMLGRALVTPSAMKWKTTEVWPWRHPVYSWLSAESHDCSPCPSLSAGMRLQLDRW